MSMRQRDDYTGQMTTGHEWNGILELNTPVPRVVWFFLGLFFIISVAMWILLPAIPLGTTYTRGLLGIDERVVVEKSIGKANKQREDWMQLVADTKVPEVCSNNELMRNIRETGRTLFEDNCAACHRLNGQGGPGFPDLVDRAWLWGGDAAAIEETIRVGINSAHPDSRMSEMPAFGRDQMLEKDKIDAAIAYVQSLSHSEEQSADAALVASGKSVFADNCSVCHGEDGKGNIQMGAPNLTDNYWLYGGDAAALHKTLNDGRKGLMPTWEARITPIYRKILAIYIQDLATKANGRTPQ